MKKYEDMTTDEKTKYFATGRCTVREIEQVIGNELVKSYIPRVRGHYIKLSLTKEIKYPTRDAAKKAAIAFRDIMRTRMEEHPC